VKQRILLVEDDRELGEDLRDRLARAGYVPTWLKDGEEALAADPSLYALVLLDLGLPGAYGLDVLKRYRTQSEVPVMIVTARDQTADKVRGLALGADDYITKPFWPEELLARIQARLRRPSMKREDDSRITVGGLVVDVEGSIVTVDGVPVELTRAELSILGVLARRAGRAVTRSDLVDEALDGARGGSDRTLDVHVSRLRKKLGSEGKRLATVWGIGYRLEVDP
jgi:two-component system response regulator MtrA